MRNSLSKARELLATAKETALARYALTDDIGVLKDELAVAPEVGPESKTLLEDLESSHERLDQLEQARTYLRIVERGLNLRFALERERFRWTNILHQPVNSPSMTSRLLCLALPPSRTILYKVMSLCMSL